MYKTLQTLDSAGAAAASARHELIGLIGTVRGQREARKLLAWTGGVVLAVGLLLSPVLARLLPFGLDGRVAAFVMNADRWNAGTALMQAQSPEAWRGLMDDFNLAKNNQALLAICREAAAKTKKEQRCTLVVPVPG
jgi:hypothetical protein